MSGEGRTIYVSPAALLLVTVIVAFIAMAVASRVSTQRAHDLDVDELYCTMAGVSPYDTGPNTGRMCADLLDDALG